MFSDICVQFLIYLTILIFQVVTMLCGIMSYVSASSDPTDQQPQGNMALFATLFLMCCVEVVIIKVISDGIGDSRDTVLEVVFGFGLQEILDGISQQNVRSTPNQGHQQLLDQLENS